MHFHNETGVIIGNRIISISQNNGLNWKEYTEHLNGYFSHFNNDIESHADNFYFFIEQHQGNHEDDYDGDYFLFRIDLENLITE